MLLANYDQIVEVVHKQLYEMFTLSEKLNNTLRKIETIEKRLLHIEKKLGISNDDKK